MIKHASTHRIVHLDDGGAGDMVVIEVACGGNEVRRTQALVIESCAFNHLLSSRSPF